MLGVIHLSVSMRWAPAGLSITWKAAVAAAVFLESNQLVAVVTAGLEGHPHPKGEGPSAAPPPQGSQSAAGREGAEEWLHFHFCLVFGLLVEGQVGLQKNTMRVVFLH